MVNGVLVLEDEEIIMDVSPGKWMKHSIE